MTEDDINKRAGLVRAPAALPGRPTRVLATLGSELGGGSYEWTRYGKTGPASGTATELNGSTGIASGTRVPLDLDGGEWYFFFPVAECS